jgi:hypothetical protein
MPPYYDAAQNYQTQQRQDNQSKLLSPYMTNSSAGNPSGSYGSSGGAQAGAYGTPAPTYGQQKQQQGQQVQGYRAPTGYPTYNAPQQQGYNYPQQTQQQAPPSFRLPGGGTDQQAMTNYYSQPQGYQNPSNPPPQTGYPLLPQNQGGGDMIHTERQGDWDVTSGGLAGSVSRRNIRTGEQQYYDWRSQQWVSGGGYVQQQPGQQPGQPGPQQSQQPGGMGAPPPNHDTNGYQSPQVVQAPASRYAMPGWDNAKWNDLNNQDPKYVVGRILSNLPGRTDQMGAAVQRIQAAYPGTQQVGNGDISIPGVGVIDILMGAGAGGRGWWWGAGQAGGGAPQAKSPAQGAGGDPYAQLMQMLTSPQPPAGYAQPQQQAAPQQTFDITKDPRFVAMQQQLAQLQTQAKTWQTESQSAAGRGGGNHPSFAYY